MYAGDPMNHRVAALLAWAVCATLGTAFSGLRLPVASAQTVSAPPPFGAPDTLRLNKGTLRSKGAPRPSSTRWARARFGISGCWPGRSTPGRATSSAISGGGCPRSRSTATLISSSSRSPTLRTALSDFDRSGFGPSVVDLVRYSASIHLACREVQWRCDPGQAVGVFFSAYREALDHPRRAQSAGNRGPRPCHSAARPSRVAGVGGAADAANARRRRAGAPGRVVPVRGADERNVAGTRPRPSIASRVWATSRSASAAHWSRRY